ncbi:hypothetical protein BH23CHL1_BH23CHL1_01860 [soil metagenome]
MHLPLIRIIPALLWMLGIFALSSQSRLPQAPGISTQLLAVAGHLVAFGVLAILIAWGAGVDFRHLSRRTLAAYALTVFYGISDEIHQSFVPGRYATVEDIMIDAIGAAAGLFVMYVVVRWRRERETP